MVKIKLSNRARNTPPSPIRKLAHLARQAKRSGVQVYHLNIGQPDVESPPEFFEGLNRYSDNPVAYEQSQGNEALCRAWSAYVNRTLGLQTAPEQFMITVGASEALVFLFLTCCDPGDEVIIFDPTYANYLGFAAISGVTLVPVLSDMEHNFGLPAADEIGEKITNRTRAILLCNPNNPTGTVYSADALRTLLDLCDEHNIFLIVDETYREYVYDGLEPLSVLQIAPNSRRVIVVDSLSKRFSICGARIGCLLTANEEVVATTLKIAQARLAGPTIEQCAAAHMLENIGESYLDSARAEYRRRRDGLYEALRGVPGVTVHKPLGAFYTMARLPVEDAEGFAAFLLADFAHNGKTTFVAPAAGFYMQTAMGAQEIRLAFVLKEPEIREAVAVLAAGLQAFLRQ